MNKSASIYVREILAKMGVTYDHCSTQVDLPQELAASVMAWGKSKIPAEILHNDGEDTKGFEDEIHSTILYGLTDDDPDAVRKIVSSVEPFSVRLGLVTAFMDKPNYDVLKIDVECPQLLKLHYALRNALKNDNKFPTYSPHCTICYLQKGKALPFLGDESFRNQFFTVSSLTYSNKDNQKIQIAFKQ